MYIGLTAEQQALREELRAYFSQLLTPELKAALSSATGEFGDTDTYKRVIRQMGADGWLGIGWPKEYGGQARSLMDQLIFTDEANIAGVFVPQLTLGTVGPTLMKFGGPEQKDFFLPPILRGELHFSIGYSEPEAGTDLASLRTRAVRDGEEFVITGQKMWTSVIQYADYIWLAARTDPQAKRHKGLSVIIVPTDAPGFSWTPVHTMSGMHVAAMYFDEVRVPVANLVGELHDGWRLMTNQLNHERVTLTSAALLRRDLADVVGWAKTATRPDGTRVIDDEYVRVLLGRTHARIEMQSLLNAKLASSQGDLNPAEASTTKVYGTELALEVYRTLIEVVGPAAMVAGEAPGNALAGRLERAYRASLVMTFGGGTNEIQRDIIGMFGLGLPYSRH